MNQLDDIILIHPEDPWDWCKRHVAKSWASVAMDEITILMYCPRGIPAFPAAAKIVIQVRGSYLLYLPLWRMTKEQICNNLNNEAESILRATCPLV